MGMFDSVQCEYKLSGLPQELIDRWGSEERIIFQTKDTPGQSLCLYKIDVDGTLWYEKKETEWVKSTTPADDSFLNSLGHLNVLSREWISPNFTGDINFYESYNHPNYKYVINEPDSKDWQRYKAGWIEYKALFKDDKLISIELILDEKPVQLDDEEFEKEQIRWKKQREEMDANFKSNRKLRPTYEQKLIDSIYDAVEEASKLQILDVDYLAKDIILKIKDYRKKVDKWYEPNN